MFFDLPDSEKRKIMRRVTLESNKMMRDTMKHTTSTEWESRKEKIMSECEDRFHPSISRVGVEKVDMSSKDFYLLQAWLSFVLDDFIAISNQSLTTRTNELLGALRMEKKYHISIGYQCPKCFSFGEEDEFCKNDRRKLIEKKEKFEDDKDEAYNQAVDEFNEKLATLKDKYEK